MLSRCYTVPSNVKFSMETDKTQQILQKTRYHTCLLKTIIDVWLYSHFESFISCSKGPLWQSQKCTASIFRVQKYYPITYLEELKKIKKPQTESWSLKSRWESGTFRLRSRNTRHLTMFSKHWYKTRWSIHYTGQCLWNTQRSYWNFTLGLKI